MSTFHIGDEEALAAFRAGPFTAGALAPVIDSNPVTLIDVPVGVGKSMVLDDLVDCFVAAGAYDLTVVLSPLKVNLEERRLVKHPKPGVLQAPPPPSWLLWPARPDLAGPRAGATTLYAKHYVCPSCPHFGYCFWPAQYSADNLRGVRVIFGTHAHLLVNRTVLDRSSRP